MTPRRFALLLAAMAALSPAPMAAEERSDRLMALLHRLPPALLTPGAAADIRFTDLATTTARGSWPEPRAGQPLAGTGPFERVDLPGFGQALAFATADDLRQTVGFDPGSLLAALAVTAGADSVQILLLADTAPVGPALEAQGYLPSQMDTFAVYQRGEADRAADPAALNPYDPFGAGQGMASRVVIEGATVYQANTWPMIEAMLLPAAAAPDLAVLALALNDTEFGFGTTPRSAALLQATLLTDQAAMSTTPGTGIPPWRIGLLADLVMGRNDLTQAIFLYATRAEAEAAQASLDEGWNRAVFPGAAPGETLGYVLGAGAAVKVLGDGPAAVVLTVTKPAAANLPALHPAGAYHNKTYDLLLKAIQSGQMPLFGPA